MISLKRKTIVVEKKKLNWDKGAEVRMFYKKGYDIFGMILYALFDITQEELARFAKPSELAEKRKEDIELITENYKHTFLAQRITFCLYDKKTSESDKLAFVKQVLSEVGITMIIR
jgi:hypothetical protein